MVLDPPVALALLVPLLGPPAVALGVDPVHLGIVLCLNLTIGLITPPVGGCLLRCRRSARSNTGHWRAPICRLPCWKSLLLVLVAGAGVQPVSAALVRPAQIAATTCPGASHPHPP
jgi:TRAP-type C4-dicarboxylate transport system permease large subunit